MEKFFSCDWGTSHFRLRLVDTVNMNVLSSRESNQGIADSFASFIQTRWDEKERRSFYLSIIQRHITGIAQELNTSLDGVPVVISGMASSSIGMVELPYKQVPFSCKGDDLAIYSMPATQIFKHNILMISGAATTADVMRGEETQLAGARGIDSATPQLLILPGTHSKHVLVRDGKVVDFKTYMTGEFFDLLSTKSVLSSSVVAGTIVSFADHKSWFTKGVAEAVAGNLLHGSFLVRTNDLFKKCSKESNYYYLSGLLIGTELKDVTRYGIDKATLVSNELLKPFYTSAWESLGLSMPLRFQPDDKSLIRGQFAQLMRKDAAALPA